MSHHNSRRLAWLGVAWRFLAFLGDVWHCLQTLAFLGNIDARRSRHSQISPLLAGIARRSRSVGSRNMQPSTAFTRRRWRSQGVGKATPSHYQHKLSVLPTCLEQFADLEFSLHSGEANSLTNSYIPQLKMGIKLSSTNHPILIDF